jgi:quinol monooxygenase YgiN
MSVTVVLECRTAEDKTDEVIAFFRKVLPDTRAYDGFESLTVHRNSDDPTSLLIWETWASRPHYEKYFQWRTDTGALGTLMQMLDGEPSIRFFDYVGA